MCTTNVNSYMSDYFREPIVKYDVVRPFSRNTAYRDAGYRRLHYCLFWGVWNSNHRSDLDRSGAIIIDRDIYHSGSADDLFHKSISGLMVAIFRTTFKSTTTTITVEDNFNCEKLKNWVHVSWLLSEIVLFSTVYEACELVVE